MLANDGIKLLDFYLIRHCSLILVCGVVVASPCARHQLDFISHGIPSNFARRRLDLSALATNVCQYDVYPQLVDGAHTLS